MKTFIFLDEAGINLAKRWRRGWEPSGWERPRTMFFGEPGHPPLNVILRGAHSKISAMGPEFPAMALRAIIVSGQSTVYQFTLYLPPYSTFLTVARPGPEINTRPRAKCGWILQLAGKTVNLPTTLAGSQWELSDSLVVVFLRLLLLFF